MFFAQPAKFSVHVQVKVRSIAMRVSVYVCLYVCLSVCLLSYIKIHFSKFHEIFLYMLTVTMARASSSNIAIRYVLPVYG